MFGSRKVWIRILFVTSCLDHWRGAFAFHVDPSIVPAIHHASISISSAVPMTPPSATTAAAAAVEFPNILAMYKQSLVTNPLPTKMVTGASLALMGDAIAQSKDDEPYNQRRAFSFMIFDACYRALQHVSFPVIVQQCQGQYIGAALTSIPYFAALTSTTTSPSTELVTSYSAAMEQTLASQLGIVPFLYYPVFYVLTSLVQGLTTEEGIARARETFIPLMKRNLLFWIPVQFVQFGFIDESLQIPFLSVCGLAWTFILSVFAGDAKNYCVNGNEDECTIDNDDYFSTTDAANEMKELEKQIIGVVEKEQQQKQERGQKQKQLQFGNEKEQVLL